MITEPPPPSSLTVTQVRGQSRLTTCQNIAPLKILQPDSHSSACHVVLSSYGGGFVQGDDVTLNISCETESRLYLTSQANTRIYRTETGLGSRQIVQGSIGDQAVAVIIPEPVVPHKDCVFDQRQRWDLAKTGSLLLVDWLHSGRNEAGEQFDYRHYCSEIDIRRDGKRLTLDRLDSEPARRRAQQPGRFGPYQTLMNIYLVGNVFASLVEKLGALTMNDEQRIGQDNRVTTFVPPTKLFTLNQIKPDLWVLRALATHRRDFQPLFATIGEAISAPSLLGFNPLSRKI